MDHGTRKYTMTSMLERSVVIYCGACGMPPEYCQYGPDFESHCLPWIRKHHPDIHALPGPKAPSQPCEDVKIPEPEVKPKPSRPWTTEERLIAFYNKYQPDKLDSVPGLLEKYVGKELQLFQALIKKYGPEPFDPFYADDDDDDDDDDDEDDMDEEEVGGMDPGCDADGQGEEEQLAKLALHDKKSRRGATAKTAIKQETRVIIQKISRNRKKATTSVIGMDTVPDVKLKDVAKAFSKKFAGSSSVKDMPNGKKEIILQGDHMDEVAIMVVEQFKVAPDTVFLDIDGEFVPFVH
jgi:density-regulated protein DRP1